MKSYLFGAPLSKVDLNMYIEAVLERYRNNGNITEGGMAYSQRLIDRQLNKARGILTFNALFFGVSFQIKNIYSQSLSILACIICLWLCHVTWSKDNSVYKTFEAEETHSFHTSRKRSIGLTLSIFLSIFSAGLISLPLFLEVLTKFWNLISR
jgi:hypothetical protein